MRQLQSSSASHGRDAPSYFPNEPGAKPPLTGFAASTSSTSPSLPERSSSGEGFTFRHISAENADTTSKPLATNPKAASILRSIAHGGHVFEPPNPLIQQGDPVRAISGSASVVLDDGIVGTHRLQSALGVESKPSYASSRDPFVENNGRMTNTGSNLGFAASGLTHLGPVRSAFKHTEVSVSGSSSGYNQSQRSARSELRHDDESQGSQGPDKPIFPEKGNKWISPDTSSFSVTTRSSEESGGPIVTMRFEHREDENGHHVLVGREGKLTHCEDEPIRAPGAVQGFGVLMVLHDDRTTGKLPVRQVSEVSLLLSS
jgi:hypothetical protein